MDKNRVYLHKSYFFNLTMRRFCHVFGLDLFDSIKRVKCLALAFTTWTNVTTYLHVWLCIQSKYVSYKTWSMDVQRHKVSIYSTSGLFTLTNNEFEFKKYSVIQRRSVWSVPMKLLRSHSVIQNHMFITCIRFQRVHWPFHFSYSYLVRSNIVPTKVKTESIPSHKQCILTLTICHRIIKRPRLSAFLWRFWFTQCPSGTIAIVCYCKDLSLVYGQRLTKSDECCLCSWWRCETLMKLLPHV